MENTNNWSYEPLFKQVHITDMNFTFDPSMTPSFGGTWVAWVDKVENDEIRIYFAQEHDLYFFKKDDLKALLPTPSKLTSGAQKPRL